MATFLPVSGPASVQTRRIVAGIGCRRGVDGAEIIALICASLAHGKLDATCIVALASVARKADEPGLVAAAAHFGVPLKTFSAAQLALAQAPASAKTLSFVGTPNVAEAAACQAGALIVPKQKSAHATCALAAISPHLDLAGFGQMSRDTAPLSSADMAASTLLTSNAGP